MRYLSKGLETNMHIFLLRGDQTKQSRSTWFDSSIVPAHTSVLVYHAGIGMMKTNRF